MIKQSDKYEVAVGIKDVDETAQTLNIKVDEHPTSSEFFSEEITIAGETVKPRFSNDFALEFSGEPMTQARLHRVSEKIHGLFCPDCNAQAYKTDHKNVAVCGDYPGWYFFYRKLDQEKHEGEKRKYIIRNGEMVEIEDKDTEVRKDQI